MSILTTFEILGTLSGTGLAYLGLQSAGLGVRYWRTTDLELRRTHRDAARIRRTWPRLARYLGLCLRDDVPTVRQALLTNDSRSSNPRIRTPRLVNIRNDIFGVTADFKLVPKVKLEDFQDRAEDLANFWRMTRVSVIQPETNLVRVRAVRTDPLTIPLTVGEPRTAPADLRYYTGGVDEYGEAARIRLHNGSGIGVYGLPTYGKTSFILGLITYLAMSDSTAFVIADGKVETGHEGDYLDVAPRALSVIGDDIAQFNAWIKQIQAFRRMRSSTIRQTLGVKNFWDIGPTAEWPLLVVVIDEAHTYFEQVKDGGDKDLRHRNGLAAENAREVADLVKKCRSVGILPVIATQKGTGDAIPTMIRDNMHASVCFAVRTDEAAIAALGSSIRDYPDANPINYQAEEYIGVASMIAERRKGFTRFRSPLCRETIAAAVCDRTAQLVRPDVLPGLTIGQAHRELISAAGIAVLLSGFGGGAT
jgi:S-DNA-T family DNA segregation ATPase FtsK/SpoIIIE